MMRLFNDIYAGWEIASINLSFHLQLCSEIPPCRLSDSLYHDTFHDADHKHEFVHLLIFDADHNSTLLLRTSIGLLLVSTFEDTRLGRRLIFALK